MNSGKSSLFSTFSAACCVLLQVVSVALIDFVYFGDGTAEDQCVSRAFRLGVHQRDCDPVAEPGRFWAGGPPAHLYAMANGPMG